MPFLIGPLSLSWWELFPYLAAKQCIEASRHGEGNKLNLKLNITMAERADVKDLTWWVVGAKQAWLSILEIDDEYTFLMSEVGGEYVKNNVITTK